jgi:hypothetical protein
MSALLRVEVQKRMFIFLKLQKYVAFPRLVGRGRGEKAKTKGGPGTKQAIFYTCTGISTLHLRGQSVKLYQAYGPAPRIVRVNF